MEPVLRKGPPALDHLVGVPTYRGQPATVPADIVGVTPAGDSFAVAVRAPSRWTLLLFLSTGCVGCRPIWDALDDPVSAGLVTDEVVVAVTHDPVREDVGILQELVPEKAVCVMSSSGWAAYRVQGPPFFALVAGGDGSGRDGPRVVAEGVAWAPEQIGSEVRRARMRCRA